MWRGIFHGFRDAGEINMHETILLLLFGTAKACAVAELHDVLLLRELEAFRGNRMRLEQG